MWVSFGFNKESLTFIRKIVKGHVLGILGSLKTALKYGSGIHKRPRRTVSGPACGL